MREALSRLPIKYPTTVPKNPSTGAKALLLKPVVTKINVPTIIKGTVKIAKILSLENNSLCFKITINYNNYN